MIPGTSLVAQWLRPHALSAGAPVQSLVRDLDPTSHNHEFSSYLRPGAAKQQQQKRLRLLCKTSLGWGVATSRRRLQPLRGSCEEQGGTRRGCPPETLLLLINLNCSNIHTRSTSNHFRVHTSGACSAFTLLGSHHYPPFQAVHLVKLELRLHHTVTPSPALPTPATTFSSASRSLAALTASRKRNHAGRGSGSGSLHSA